MGEGERENRLGGGEIWYNFKHKQSDFCRHQINETDFLKLNYPFSMRAEMTSTCPFLAANIRAVQPLSLFTSTSTDPKSTVKNKKTKKNIIKKMSIRFLKTKLHNVQHKQF